MEINKETTQYTNQLHNIEAQITQTQREHLNGLEKKSSISDVCCAKICIGIITTLILSPFPICDVYYATTDTTCVNQNQQSHNLNIILQSYLLASGIMTIIFIGTFNFSLFVLDVNIIHPNKNDTEINFCLKICDWVSRGFGLSWLILGCVLFWGYTNMENCSQSVHDYLFARFILGIIFFVSRTQYNNDQ